MFLELLLNVKIEVIYVYIEDKGNDCKMIKNKILVKYYKQDKRVQ